MRSPSPPPAAARPARAGDEADVLVYGAYGYTGRKVVAELLARGVRPFLAGRDAAALQAFAQAHDLPHKAFALRDLAAAPRLRVPVLFQCAGPYAATWEAGTRLALALGADYLDLSSEWETHAACLARDARWREAGRMVLPGAGADIAVLDLLRAGLAQEAPLVRASARYYSTGLPSRGAALCQQAWRPIRLVSGTLAPAPEDTEPAWDLPNGPRAACLVPDPALVAFQRAGIHDAEVRTVLPARWDVAVRRFAVRGWEPRELDEGRSVYELSASVARGDGSLADDDAPLRTVRFEGPPRYTLSARLAAELAVAVLGGARQAGHAVPSDVLSPDALAHLGEVAPPLALAGAAG